MRVVFGKSIVACAVVALLVGACTSQSESDFIRQGKAFMAKGDVPAAIISFKNAVQADTSSLDARLALAEALERSGDPVGAEQEFRRALSLSGSADKLVPRIALLLRDRGDLEAIVREFATTELPQSDADAELRGIVALAELSLGHQAAAQAQLQQAVSRPPAVVLARAQMEFQSGRGQDAVSELDAEIGSGKAPWWFMRSASRIYAASGNQEKALDAMRRTSELMDVHPGVIGEYAELLVQAGRFADAQPLREKLKKIAPRHFRTAYTDALFQMQEGKFDEAHESATKVLAIAPDHVPSLLIAAKVALDRGQLASAESQIEKVLAMEPASVQALRMKFMLELRRGDTVSAMATLQQTVALAPNDRWLQAASAYLAWGRGDKNGAIAQLTKAAEMQPPQVELFARLAEMKAAVGRQAEAAKTIEQAIDAAGDDNHQREQVFGTVLRLRMLDKARTMAQAELARRPNDPAPFLWTAAVAGIEGKESEALAQIGRALDRTPDYYPALTALAKTANAPERVAEYRRRLQKAVDGKTKDVRIYLDRARRLSIDGGSVEEVGEAFALGLVVDPTSVPLREAAVRHWLAWGRKDKAEALAVEGERSAEPGHVPTIALAAYTYEAAGKFEQAAEKYEELQRHAPDRVEWGLRQAQALVKSGRVDQATVVLRKLSSLHPDEASPYQLLAQLQVDQKQPDAALTTVDLMSHRPKLMASSLLLRGDVHAWAGNKDEAIKAYDQAGKEGAAELALLRKVTLHDRTEASALADSELSGWLNRNPQSVPALYLAARRENAKRNYSAAVRYLEAVVKLAPNNPLAINDLAWDYARTNRPEALAIAKRAFVLAPDNPQILDTLAEAYRLAGQRSEAIAVLRAAVSLAPGNAIVRVHLAELLSEDGRKQEAVRLLEGLDQDALDGEARALLKRIAESG